MRVKKKSVEDGDVEVSMSPLIDCVFLLLIFFLATTMIKKTEQRIPLESPDDTMSLSEKVVIEQNYIGMVDLDTLKYPTKQKDQYDRYIYKDINDLDKYLTELAKSGGQSKVLVLQVQKDVQFQDVLKLVDKCALKGFKKIKTQLESESFDSKWKGEKNEDSE